MDAFSDDFDQSIDEHMAKFKGLSSMKQFLQLKPSSTSSTGYLYEFNLYVR